MPHVWCWAQIRITSYAAAQCLRLQWGLDWNNDLSGFRRWRMEELIEFFLLLLPDSDIWDALCKNFGEGVFALHHDLKTESLRGSGTARMWDRL